MPWLPASSITASTRSNEPMLPGLMRSAAAPRRAASMARRWSKWMSATTGSGLWAQISPKPSSAAALGMATRMISHPAFARPSICASVDAGSSVFVVHMDCTDTGAPPPTATLPTCTWCVSSRAGRTLFSSLIQTPYRPRRRQPITRRTTSFLRANTKMNRKKARPA